VLSLLAARMPAALHLRGAALPQRSLQRRHRVAPQAPARGVRAAAAQPRPPRVSLSARAARAAVCCRAVAAPGEAPPEQEPPDEDDDVWGSPMEELWAGWEDPSPENFFVIGLSFLLFGALALISIRILVVFCAILIAAAKYTVVALLLALFGVVSSTTPLGGRGASRDASRVGKARPRR